MTMTRRGNWLLLIGLSGLVVSIAAVQLFLIRPFAPQTPGLLALAFTLRRWSPWLTLGASVAALLLVWRIWRASPRVGPRATVLLLTALLIGSSWVARQNHFEWMFAPLPDARFVSAAEAGFVAPDDMVLAVALEGDAAAYPVRQLAYHHLVDDAVGKVPIVATY
jgi:hypothetical protein